MFVDLFRSAAINYSLIYAALILEAMALHQAVMDFRGDTESCGQVKPHHPLTLRHMTWRPNMGHVVGHLPKSLQSNNHVANFLICNL